LVQIVGLALGLDQRPLQFPDNLECELFGNDPRHNSFPFLDERLEDAELFGWSGSESFGRKLAETLEQADHNVLQIVDRVRFSRSCRVHVRIKKCGNELVASRLYDDFDFAQDLVRLPSEGCDWNDQSGPLL